MVRPSRASPPARLSRHRADAGNRHDAERDAGDEAHRSRAARRAIRAARSAAAAASRCARDGDRRRGDTRLMPLRRAHGFGLRLSMRPERSRTTRSQRARERGSCVTRISVMPRSTWPANRRSITCWPVFSSRLPVGSSATRIAGIGRERARQRDALLLAAGELRRDNATAARQGRRAASSRCARAHARRQRRRAPAAPRHSRAPSWSGSDERTETRCRHCGRESARAHLRRER